MAYVVTTRLYVRAFVRLLTWIRWIGIKGREGGGGGAEGGREGRGRMKGRGRGGFLRGGEGRARHGTDRDRDDRTHLFDDTFNF
jgi:hypothetical protein